jgi:hypothetical protein
VRSLLFFEDPQRVFEALLKEASLTEEKAQAYRELFEESMLRWGLEHHVELAEDEDARA